MSTNLQNREQATKLPAGVVGKGIEAFWYNNEKWLIYKGHSMRFIEASITIQNMIVMCFRMDKESRTVLTKMGITKFHEQFDTWYKCVVGALDHEPDILNDQLRADVYNSSCQNFECHWRGLLCGRASGLRSHDVQTIIELQRGLTAQQIANQLHLSVAAIKSRIEKLKLKLGVPNTAALVARASELGISVPQRTNVNA